MAFSFAGEPGAHPEDVLTAVLAQIVSCTGLDQSLVFPVTEEYPALKLNKSVQVVTVFPSQLIPDVGQQSGGSQNTFVLDSVYVIKLWSTFAVDQTGQALQWYNNSTRGAYQLMRRIMLGDGSGPSSPTAGLEQATLIFQVGNPKAGQNILEEPMRLSPGGWTVDAGHESGMRALRGEFIANFLCIP